jgi:hypothetical protein
VGNRACFRATFWFGEVGHFGGGSTDGWFRNLSADETATSTSRHDQDEAGNQPLTMLVQAILKVDIFRERSVSSLPSPGQVRLFCFDPLGATFSFPSIY